MNQILCCNWLAGLMMLSCPLEITCCVLQEYSVLFPYINPLLTKLMFGQDGWILASLFSCVFMDLGSLGYKHAVHKHAKK